jgi:hypothetical protein
MVVHRRWGTRAGAQGPVCGSSEVHVGDHRHACRKRFPDRGRCSRSEARPPNYVMSRAHQSAWDPQRHLRGRRQADERPTTVGILVPDRITRLPREPAGPVGIMPLTSGSRTSFAPCQQAYRHQHFGEQTKRRDRRRLRGILRYRGPCYFRAPVATGRCLARGRIRLSQTAKKSSRSVKQGGCEPS